MTLKEAAAILGVTPDTIAADLISRHAGISPLSMQRLLDHFRGSDDLVQLSLLLPESRDAAQSYANAFGLCQRLLGGDFGPPGRQLQLGILVTGWMRGLPLSHLVGERVTYMRRERGVPIARVIREVMADVEQIARFQAPKFLACYADILRLQAVERGVELDDGGFRDISMMLELGVSRPTDVSLMALGLSRTSTIAVSEYIVDDNLSSQAVLTWLQSIELDTLDLPVLVKREILRALAAKLREREG